MTKTRPIVDSRIRQLQNDPAKLKSWVDCFGSPLHLMFPEIAVENGRRWSNGLKSSYSNIDLRFALKSCKSHALAVAFARSGLGMDVSSAEELLAAMRAYVPREHISFTGPDKPDHDLALCIAHGVLLNIDSFSELDRFVGLQRTMGLKARAVLRLRPSFQPASRFGFAPAELLAAAKRLNDHDVNMEGISFHLSGYCGSERINAATEALSLLDQLASHQIVANSLSIGGGFLLSYFESPLVEGDRSSKDYWLGQMKENIYPYFGSVAAEAQACQIVQGILANNENRRVLERHNLRLILEPGRSLTDQCGSTVFRVLGTKITDKEIEIAILEGMSFSLSETWFNSDFAPQPNLVSMHKQATATTRYVLAGRSCLESDIIRWSAIDFGVALAPGDLIYVHNTAGYQMDSNESTFHQIPLPEKVAIFWHDGTPQCVRDEHVNIRSFVTP